LADPSLLMALPRITARMVSPSACASASRLTAMAPPPLPHTVPAARASNGRQCPSGDSVPPSA
jgi:hypothetical protein